MHPNHSVVIVGSGHGGTHCALMLRQMGHAGPLTIVSDDTSLPYQRPPLSKDYLVGVAPFEKILIRPEALWSEKSIDLQLGAKVMAVDPTARAITLDDQRQIRYDSLVWAAGGEARRLSCEGHDLAGIHHVRRRDDVDALLKELPDARRIVIVGGGYIGLEVAAGLAGPDRSVVLVEAADRVLSRVAGEMLSRFYEHKHRENGVEIRLSTVVSSIVAGSGRVAGVALEDGEIIPADLVIVGIGLVPNVAPLVAAGAQGGNGIDVDDLCRTSLPGIFAIGDCAAHPNPFAQGRRIRLESVQNAQDQATTVAKALCGTETPYAALPWFWSSQFELRLQTIGLSAGHDQALVRGDMTAGSFSIIYLREGRVIALDCINAVKDYTQGRTLITSGEQLPVDILLDPERPLRSTSPSLTVG
jgi:3-phenylpropionate/trans-cinnamate dioxygenase ferredoxin reductase component